MKDRTSGVGGLAGVAAHHPRPRQARRVISGDGQWWLVLCPPSGPDDEMLGALLGGHEADRQPLRMCRAVWPGGVVTIGPAGAETSRALAGLLRGDSCLEA